MRIIGLAALGPALAACTPAPDDCCGTAASVDMTFDVIDNRLTLTDAEFGTASGG